MNSRGTSGGGGASRGAAGGGGAGGGVGLCAGGGAGGGANVGSTGSNAWSANKGAGGCGRAMSINTYRAETTTANCHTSGGHPATSVAGNACRVPNALRPNRPSSGSQARPA